MFQYHCLNPIAQKGLDIFDEKYRKADTLDDCQAVLVRSAKMHDLELPESVAVIARAGAGVNNIPVKECAEKGIVVFNTPGANANGVKELVLAGMLLASRDIVGGIEWVQREKDQEDIDKLAEKQKKQFAGCEIMGKKLGIIGLGAIGSMVANAAASLGMEVYGYDPYISIDAAWNLSRTIKHSKSLDEIYSKCDYITVHVPLLDSTKKMINKEAFDKMKDGVVLLNFARDLLVDEDALIEALNSGKVKKYVTDFANHTVAGHEGILVTPHLGASTEESEENCAVMAVKEVRDFLENGNIKNSVNFPNCDMGTCVAVGRIAITHKNIPNMISQLTKILFPIVVTIIAGLVAPASVALVGFLMFGNLLRECGVLNALSETAQNVLTNLITIVLGLTVAGQMTADQFVRPDTLLILALGLVAFVFDTIGGVLFAKLLNLFLPEGKKLNPMIGAAGISAFPMSGRVVNKMGLEEDNQNFLLMYSISVNVSGQIASVIAGGLLLTLLGA